MDSNIDRALCPPLYRDHVDEHQCLPPKPSSVCQVCWEGPLAAHLGLFYEQDVGWIQDRDSKWPRLTAVGGYAYSTSWTHLERGSAEGCAWCRFLLDSYNEAAGIGGEVPPRLDGTMTISMGRDKCVSKSPSPLDVQTLGVIVIDDENRTYISIACNVLAAEDDPAAQCIIKRCPILDVGSSRSLSLAKDCLNSCIDGHQLCSAISPPFDVPLPTRLIDCTDFDRPLLALTEGMHGKYLALSYVWGEEQLHQTTTSNISTYANGIDLSILPSTIRDAIRITIALGFRFLWVDSLCIVQDSSEDQRYEIGRMHLIYRFAYSTIVAASANRVSEGFLQDRLPPGEVTLPFICPSRPSEPRDDAMDALAVSLVGEVHLCRRRVTGYLPLQPNGCARGYGRTRDPIELRGWCLQEYYMSPRTLLFTSDTLQFMCQTATQNIGNTFYNPQASGLWIPGRGATQIEQRLPSALLLQNPPRAEPHSEEWMDVYNRWLVMVEDYTFRAPVGRSSDKLVACGAIAKAFQRVLNVDYLAGLWRVTLLQDLLWTTISGTCTRPVTYRAPTWSWASVDGFVSTVPSWGGVRVPSNPPMITFTFVEVIDCAVVLEDRELPFGQVKAGLLTLRAVLVPCHLYPAEVQGWYQIGLLRFTPGCLWRRGVEVSAEGGTTLASPAPLDSGAHLDTKTDAGIKRAWLIPFFQYDRDCRDVVGLVVALADSDASTTEGRKVYRRIGTFFMSHWHDRNNAELNWTSITRTVPPTEVVELV